MKRSLRFPSVTTSKKPSEASSRSILARKKKREFTLETVTFEILKLLSTLKTCNGFHADNILTFINEKFVTFNPLKFVVGYGGEKSLKLVH